MNLPIDIQASILAHWFTPRYFMTNRIAYSNRNHISVIVHYLKYKTRMRKGSQPYMCLLLKLYRRKCTNPTRYVLEFIANKNRAQTIVRTPNSWFRKKVHDLCTTFKLKHETFSDRTQKKRVCIWCEKEGSYKIVGSEYGYDAYCDACKESTRDWGAIGSLISIKDVIQKDVRISKINHVNN